MTKARQPCIYVTSRSQKWALFPTEGTDRVSLRKGSGFTKVNLLKSGGRNPGSGMGGTCPSLGAIMGATAKAQVTFLGQGITEKSPGLQGRIKPSG